jgi:hypothetical protein
MLHYLLLRVRRMIVVVMRVTMSLPCNVVLMAVGWIANAIGQNSWVPLDGYFDPYFEGIHT